MYIMSDSYLGVDATFPVRLKVAESTAEEKEARASRVTKVVQMDSDGEMDDDVDGTQGGRPFVDVVGCNCAAENEWAHVFMGARAHVCTCAWVRLLSCACVHGWLGW